MMMKLKNMINFTIVLVLLGCVNNEEDETTKIPIPAVTQQKSIEKESFILDRYQKDFDWSKIEVKMKDSEKSRLINKLKPHFAYFLESEFHIDEFNEKLHFVDLNDDGKLDVVFHGWSGGEPDILRFYTQTKTGFDFWFEVLQDPLEIIIKDNRIKEITTLDDGCCDAYQVTISKYQVRDKLKLISQTSYIDWMDMYGTDIEPTKFEILLEKYFVRDAPKLDNETVNDRFETKGNSIGELAKGQKGTAYKSKTDANGRTWWLMQSEPMDSLKNSIFYNETNFKTSFIGWVSSRYVKVIK